MKKNLFKSFLFTVVLATFGLAQAEDKLNYGVDRGSMINLADYEGRTFLSFMQEVVKPAIDAVALDGYTVADGKTVSKALDVVDSKVRRNAIRAAGGEDNLVAIADALNQSGEKYTLYTLPDAIRNQDPSVDRFDLSTFLGLASGGGVAIKFYENNYAYNIHYGTGAEDKDVQTGRSFGASPGRDANDASDAAYLRDLQEYAQGDDVSGLYRVIIEVLTNCDVSGYSSVSELGAIVLTDFLAVYVAEQDRNLMKSDFELEPWWDASLLEATLLSYFHAGQDEMWMMFMTPPTQEQINQMEIDQRQVVADCIENGGDKTACERKVVGFNESKLIFTNKTLKQERGGTARTEIQDATMVDYWQFSFTVHKSHRGRSGINVTKPTFRALGKEITSYIRKTKPELVDAIEAYFPEHLRGGNVYEELSQYLINYNTPSQLGPEGKGLATAFEAFLDQTYKDANKITENLKKNPRYSKAQFELLK